jgi:hypothetical protein
MAMVMGAAAALLIGCNRFLMPFAGVWGGGVCVCVFVTMFTRRPRVSVRIRVLCQQTLSARSCRLSVDM